MKQKKQKPVLVISDLSIWRGETLILDNISWQVEQGEHWAILGANGSGKTSLLSALTGYLMPSSGDMELLGEKYGKSDWRELRKKIGLVSSSIRQRMADSETALESVVSGKYAMIDLWNKPTRADSLRAKKILKQIECEHLRERPWLFLSQGERQRILIGRALMADPALLILDEPCAGLDPVAREYFLQFINHLGKIKNGTALVFVTHHVEEILPIFSHVLLLKNGQLLAAGKRTSTLTSQNFSETFDAQVRLTKVAGRYHLSVAEKIGGGRKLI
ncbi:MAG: ABC transporter ATP-binding protein [Verrucomicrobiota bacterium]|nr:ABC transporter ATP-binding protein [Verrucomicrobiota bacterium]